MKPAVVLLSGGLDSATVLAWMRREGFACHALSFRYGQRHSIELDRAAEIARALGAVEHRVAEIDDPALNRVLAEKSRSMGFRIEPTSLEIKGLCADCAAGSAGHEHHAREQQARA